MNITDFDTKYQDLQQITLKTSSHFIGQNIAAPIPDWFSLWSELSKEFPTINYGQDDQDDES